MMQTEMKTTGNRHLLAMWLVLTTYHEELQERVSRVSGFNWNWFRAFCTELRITNLFNFVNVTITRAEESPLWSDLSLETRQCLSIYFERTPEDVVDDVRAVLLELCEYRYNELDEDTQRSVVNEIWLQGRMAINTRSWCQSDSCEVLRLKLPDPQIKW